jgi:signal transduction histidine kinase
MVHTAVVAACAKRRRGEAYLVSSTDDTDRRRLHLEAAQRLEASGGRPFELAYHYDAAGEAQRGLPHAVQAAEAARAERDMELAERYYRMAARGLGDATESVLRYRVTRGLGEVLLARAQHDECERYLDEAFQVAGDDSARAEVEERRARLAIERGDSMGAIQHGERALQLIGRHVPRSALICTLIVLCEVLVQVAHTALPRWFVGRRSLAGAERELLAVRLYDGLEEPYRVRRGTMWGLWAQLRARNLGERYPAPPGDDALGSTPGVRVARGHDVPRGSGAMPAMSPELAAANTLLEDALCQLRATKDQLLHAGRMAAVGTLIAGLSHELNNPLTVIIGNVEHLRGLSGDDEQIVRVINAIDRQAKRAARLVNTLLRFSRTGGASREQVAPHEIIKLVVDLVAAEARRREIELRVNVAEGLSPLFVARHEIESALVNLTTNALQATPEGGVVELSAASEQRDPIPGIRFVVRDTGVGIAPEILPQIFDPFFTTKPEGEGTGLGLSLSREIATAHGGDLTVVSVPGRGTTMTLWLPDIAPPPRSSRTRR